MGLAATSGVAANPAIAVFASKLTASDRTDVAYAMTFPTSTIMKIVLIQHPRGKEWAGRYHLREWV